MRLDMKKLITTFLLLLLPMISGCFATGTAIVTGQTRPALDSTVVKLYAEAPAKYETIGLVEAKAPVGFDEQEAVNEAILELKNQAANIGADGIILTGSGENSTSTTYGDANYVYSVVDEEKVVKGKAIVVIQE